MLTHFELLLKIFGRMVGFIAFMEMRRRFGTRIIRNTLEMGQIYLQVRFIAIGSMRIQRCLLARSLIPI